jgi:hypothetical protein
VLQVKITNADIIKSGERELIDTIISDLDWDSIEKVVKERHKLSIQDDVEYQQGDIVVYNNQVAYKLNFEVKMTLSVVFDRDGNYLSIATSADSNDEEETQSDQPLEDLPDQPMEEDVMSVKDVENEGINISEPEAPNTIERDAVPSIDPEMEPKENFSKMASHIADMISDINEDED